MSSDVAFAIALTAGLLAIFVSTIPTEHHCKNTYCPHLPRKEDDR